MAEESAKVWVAELNITSAIHVRLWDKMTAFANIVPLLHYYYQAIETLPLLFPHQTQLFVACVHGQLLFRDMHVVSNAVNPSFDMAVIAACQHKIISIGTLGWWGAFMTDTGTNETPAVIYHLPQVEEIWKD